MSNRTIIHNDAEMQTIYQKSLNNVVCPEELHEKVLAEMHQVQTRHSLWTHLKRPAAAVLALLLVGGILLSDTRVANAFEQMVTKGIGYFVKDINGVEEVTIFKHNASWNREIEDVAHNLSEWQKYYPEFYAELEANNLLDVFLPHYKMGEYEWEDTVAYIGGPLREGEASMGAKFIQDDSQFLVSIHKRYDDTSFALIHKVDKQYQMEVNGIVYEVLEISEDYTYEEYYKIAEYTFKDSQFVPEDEAWFEELMKHPILVKTMINGVNYSYMLSGDIDLEEFLESIY